jgi:hypothetical protein
MAEFAAAVVEPLDEECPQLIQRAASAGSTRAGMAYRLPVNFVLYEQAVVFRTGQDSPMGRIWWTGADAIMSWLSRLTRSARPPGKGGDPHPRVGSAR